MVDIDVIQDFVEYPPENGTITKTLYEYDMAAPINEHPDCSEHECLRDVEHLVDDPDEDVAVIKLHGTKIVKVEPDRYRAIREKTNYEDVPPHPNILKISHFTYHERTDCYVFIYDLGCEVKTLSEFVKTATLEDRKCLIKQVIELVQHFHTYCILYGHFQPDLMYVALSKKDRKPQLKVGSFLKTAFYDTRTEIPDFSGSSKEESTMLEDLKDAAHVINFIYNKGDGDATNRTENVMKELQSMSLDIEDRKIGTVMTQLWSVLHNPDENKSLTVRARSSNSQVEQDEEMLLMSPEINRLVKLERHQQLLRFCLEEVMSKQLQFNNESFVNNNKNCIYSSFISYEFVKPGSTPSQPGFEIIHCKGCSSSSSGRCTAADEKCSEQTEEKRLQSFPPDWNSLHPTLYECFVLAKQGFRYIRDRNMIQLIIPCFAPVCELQSNSFKQCPWKQHFDPGQTRRTLANKDKSA